MLAATLILACAQPVAWTLDVRADPIVFAILGWSVGVDGGPEDSRWRASLAAFHADVPELLVPLVARGVPGLRVAEDALQLGAFYDVGDAHRGLYFGPELYIYALHYTAGADAASAREAYAHVTAGYTWFPFDGVGLFVEPWGTLGVPIFHSGGADLGPRHVEDRVLNFHATASLGWRFL